MKKAFTLMEVNLAILVMAAGILSVVTLYSMGFRESVQSREDVAAAAFADAVLGQLATALSDPTMTWEDFESIACYPGVNGWGEYMNSDGDIDSSAAAKARSAFSTVMGKTPLGTGNWPVPGDWKGVGLVVARTSSRPGIVSLGFRACEKKDQLLTSPLFYTEVRFQGTQENAE